jgi:hypothetical protein
MNDISRINKGFELSWVDHVVKTYNDAAYISVPIYSEGPERVFVPIPIERAASMAMNELGLSQRNIRLWKILVEAAKMCIGTGNDYEERHQKREEMASRASEIFGHTDIGHDIDPQG